jgi:hypothetical protein
MVSFDTKKLGMKTNTDPADRFLTSQEDILIRSREEEDR